MGSFSHRLQSGTLLLQHQVLQELCELADGINDAPLPLPVPVPVPVPATAATTATGTPTAVKPRKRSVVYHATGLYTDN